MNSQPVVIEAEIIDERELNQDEIKAQTDKAKSSVNKTQATKTKKKKEMSVTQWIIFGIILSTTYFIPFMFFVAVGYRLYVLRSNGYEWETYRNNNDTDHNDHAYSYLSINVFHNVYR